MRKQTIGVLVIGGCMAAALLAVPPGGPGTGWLDISAVAQEAATELTFDVAIENGKVAEDTQAAGGRLCEGAIRLLRS
jgi:hypothetical protein